MRKLWRFQRVHNRLPKTRSGKPKIVKLDPFKELTRSALKKSPTLRFSASGSVFLAIYFATVAFLQVSHTGLCFSPRPKLRLHHSLPAVFDHLTGLQHGLGFFCFTGRQSSQKNEHPGTKVNCKGILCKQPKNIGHHRRFCPITRLISGDPL